MVPEENLSSGAAESPQSKAGGGPRRGRRGGRGRRGRGRGGRPVRAQRADDAPVQEETPPAPEMTIEDRIEGIEPPEEPSPEELAELDTQPAEAKGKDYDEEPPQELAEGDL